VNTQTGATNTSAALFLGTGNIGIASTTPSNKITVATGSVATWENTDSTSSSITIDWTQGNQHLIKMGSTTMTIAFSNPTPGQAIRVITCNGAGVAAGAITWTGVSWPSQTVPTQTTTINNCDVYSFIDTAATGTNRIFGAQTPGY